MVAYSAGSADKAVVAAAYGAATKLTKDPKILLALFEAGIVESNFHNDTSATDHDSLGYLQQRPSQGWPNPTDVPTATKSFVVKAQTKLTANPHLTAEQLAQAVQVSAYPDRYGQAQQAAQTLLAGASGGSFSVLDLVPGVGVAEDALGAVADAIRTTFAPLASVAKVSDEVFKVFLPSNFIRLCSGIAGAFFLIIGIHLLTREVRHA